MKLHQIATTISYVVNSFTDAVEQLHIWFAPKFGNRLIGMHF
jgi:hypothetical protein